MTMILDGVLVAEVAVWVPMLLRLSSVPGDAPGSLKRLELVARHMPLKTTKESSNHAVLSAAKSVMHSCRQ